MKPVQMAIADVAYTNAKRNSDLEGMVASLIYRTLERNTSGGEALRPFHLTRRTYLVIQLESNPAYVLL